MSTESRAQKNLKPRGFVHWAHAGALRVNVIVVEAVFVVQEASACALKVAHRNAACVVETGVHIFCVFTRFLSFLICSSRAGHPTEVFLSTRVCSSRTCAQANSPCLEQCACTYLVISLRGGSCYFVHSW